MLAGKWLQDIPGMWPHGTIGKKRGLGSICINSHFFFSLPIMHGCLVTHPKVSSFEIGGKEGKRVWRGKLWARKKSFVGHEGSKNRQ